MQLVDLMRSRLSSASAPGNRKDAYHLALVLEGGGMRGVISIGLAAGLEKLGLTGTFDSIHGSSAGACAAAYFAAGQSDLGGSIYYEDINNDRFIDTWRPSRGRPVMDLDFLVDDVMVNSKPLDASPFLRRPNYVNIVLTDAERGSSQSISNFDSTADVRAALRASAFIPLIAGKYANYRGRRYLDGGLIQQIAIQSALDVGATHILVLLTRKFASLFRREASASRSVELAMMRLFYNPTIADIYADRAKGINRSIRQILGEEPSTAEILSLAPSEGSPQLSRLTRDGALLKDAYDDAKRRTIDAFEEQLA